MTDRIDLDDVDTDDEHPDDESNRGDWFWRGEGDPDDEPDGGFATAREPGSADEATPRVPRESDDSPVGIPVESGGAGGTAAGERPGDAASHTPDDATSGDATPDDGTSRPTTGAAPHGDDADGMTMALTYRAARRLATPGAAFDDARGWADWVGIVGRVETPVINRFQRQNGVDADFFSGTGTDPGDRLAEIDRESMFYADRMVVVGVAGADERVAAAADWEFVPLTEAAEKADWALDGE